MKLLIKEIAKQRGITLNEIAERVGIAQPSISRIINGVFNPKLDTLERISDIFTCNTSDIRSNVYSLGLNTPFIIRLIEG